LCELVEFGLGKTLSRKEEQRAKATAHLPFRETESLLHVRHQGD
jgi:hypothetical protein